MATGYLVTLGDGNLDDGDFINASQSTFDIDTNIGTGSWIWSGVWDGDGQTYNGVSDTGVYYTGTDGNVYFIPDTWFSTSGTAEADNPPAYTSLTPDGTVDGTAGADTIDENYTDADGESVTAGNDDIAAGAGDDTVYGGGGNDTIDGGDDNDFIVGDQTDANDGQDNISGGSGDDVIYGDTAAGTDNSPTLVSWENQGLSDETSIAGGTTATSADGNINITVSVANEANFYGASVETGDALYDYNGANDSSSLAIEGGNIATGGTLGNDQNAAVVTLDFSAAEAGYSDEVSNVTFGIFDIDELDGQFLDQVIVTAYDANGVAIPVTVTIGSTTTLTSTTNANGSQTVTAIVNSGGAGNTDSITGYAEFSVAGPVSYIEIDYNNVDTAYGGHAIRIGDVELTPIPEEPTDGANDTIQGDTGDDLIYGQGGDDSIDGGADNDTVYGGLGEDSVSGGAGQDTLFGGEGRDDMFGGTGNDSVTGGDGDDTVTLGDGNDTFGDWSTEDGDDTVYGGAGNDTINGGNDEDEIYGGADDDVLIGASGNDEIYGGTGSDQIQITDDHESDVIEGGEDGDGSDIDIVDFSNYESTAGVTVTSTGDEAGTYDFDGTVGDGSYIEIEGVDGTSYDDTFNMGSDNSGISIDAQDGDDILISGSGDDTLDGDAGADTFNAGAGDDQINLGDVGGANTNPDGDADIIILQDGFGNDYVTNFDAPTPDGDGTFTGIDTLDVSDLYDLPLGDPDRTPVLTNDVVVTDDGSGNALLTFPNGETITLEGINPSDADNPFYLNAIGIPMPDGTVEGTAGNDTINNSYIGDPDGDMVDNDDAILPGDTGNDDLIYGYGGNDNIYSNQGDDEVYGGSGDDLLQDSSGSSTLFGGADNDTINSGSGNDTSYGGTGDDTINASIGSDEIYGGDGNDTMAAGGYAGAGDTMDGGAGDDTITGGSGNDTMTGGTGDDTFNVASNGGTDSITGGEDGDGSDVDTLNFSDANGPDGVSVTMTGDEDGTYSNAGETGNGTFSEIEQINLTNQDDNFDGVLATGGNTVDGGAGDDVLVGSSGSDSFEGGTGNDTLNANEGDDELYGGAGDDTIYGDEGEDTIAGGADNDALYGGQDDDTLDGGDGSDTVEGGDGNDTLAGGDGADTIIGGADQDVIYGGVGDVINGSESGVDNDTLIVSDVDYIDYDSGNPENGTVYFNGGGSLTFTNIENVEVSDRDGTVSGTAGNDLINASYTGDPDGDQVDDTDAILVGHAPDDDLIEAGAGNDTIYSGLGDDTVYAGTGNDTVAASTGDDTIFGDAGDDLLFGQAGSDTIYGGDDDDVINGGTEADSLYGGEGDDRFVTEAGFGSDVIEGGEAGTDNDEIWSTQSVDMTITATGDEAGSITDGTSTATFTEIESIETEGGNDTIDLSNDSAGMTVDAGAGDDVITGGSGDDDLQGASGDDTFNLNNGFGDDTITGGETGETGGDTLDASQAETDLTVDLSTLSPSNPETGTISDGAGTTTFTEIENITLGSGDDSVTGSTGDENVDLGSGADTIEGGEGDDAINLGSNVSGSPDGDADVMVLEDGFGNDTITNFDAPTPNGDGTFTGIDTVDVTNLLDAGGDPVNVNDVTVTDDGFGNAVLTFPNTESITLIGIDPDDADDPFYLNAIGIPLSDGTVSGTAGNDTINGAYTGDPDGDMVDNDDAILAGDVDDDDLIEAGAGDDTITGGSGDDEMYGGADQDFFDLADGHGSDTIFGGETGVDEDTVDFDNTAGISVAYTGDEAGTATDGTSDVTFSEIENLHLTGTDDVVDATLDTVGVNILAGDGNDSVTGGSGDDTVGGGAGSDTLAGGAGEDHLDGDAGNDSIDGGAGDDVLIGDSGNDTLTGGTGADDLYAGADDDTITIAEGDQAYGGSGDDLFVLEDLGEPTNGTITVDGGAGDETGGDTLQLGGLVNLTNAVKDTFVDDGTGSFSGSVTLDDGTVLNFSEIENIICFAPNTRIATPNGLVAIGDLEVGDLVVTRDHGLQPIRWIEGRTVPAVDRFAPVRIRQNVLSGQERDLIVSPQHRILFQGYRAELLFGESEVLVSAKHLVDGLDVTQDEAELVTYVHMMFDQHEIIYAEGAATESFHPGDIGFSAVTDKAREELFAIFPELRADQSQYGATARRCLKQHEAKLLHL